MVFPFNDSIHEISPCPHPRQSTSADRGSQCCLKILHTVFSKKKVHFWTFKQWGCASKPTLCSSCLSASKWLVHLTLSMFNWPPHAELKTWGIEHSLLDRYQQSLMVLTQWEWRIIGEFASTWYLNACWGINSSMVSNFIILPCLGEECASREHECQIEEIMEGVGSNISKTAH